MADSGTTFDGTSFTTTLERTGLHAGETNMVKSVTKMFPRIEGTGTVQISIGAENEPFSVVTYDGPFTYTIGSDHKIDCRVRGRYIAVKFETTTDTTFKLSGYSLETEAVSTR